MSRFNRVSSTKCENLAGGESYKESPKLEFLSILLTSFVKDQFYRKADNTIGRIKTLMKEIDDKQFLAKAAIFARDEFNMRSVSHVVASNISAYASGQKWLRRFFKQVVVRPDDMTEIVAAYLERNNGRPLPSAMKKGFADAFEKFDRYQIAKYKAEDKQVSLRDIVNLVRPTPSIKNKQALKELIEGTLKSERTFRTELSKAGQDASNEEEKQELKAQAWKELIESRSIGYMQLLMNLRNILQQAPEMVEKACELLTNEKMIRKSRVLPFRFTTALEEVSKISGSREVIMALNKALDIATKNVPVFEGKTLIVVDASGSMQSARVSETAALFAAVLLKSNPTSELMLFGSRAWYQEINPMDSTLTIASQIQNHSMNTDFKTIFTAANKAYDRIIILSDMQGWVGYYTPSRVFADYKNKYGCNPHVFSIDLAGYGTLQFPERNVYALAGFSEKIFDIIPLLETDRQALLKKVESVKI